MTIAAFRRLLDEIDAQGGPDAARHNRLHLPDDEGTPKPMTTAPAQPTPVVDVQLEAGADVRLNADTEKVPVGQLLAWGEEHPDAEVQDQAARARVLLTGLRRRHAADQELAAITTEEEQLAKRLADLQARKAELVPAKPKKQRKPVDYPAAEVRSWAAANGVDCPPVGRVPKAVVDAWRTATGNTS
ncbi:hypothetical protein ACFY78_18750 [Streptomyces olindensis]|uniref:Lsr2 family DNA-binding protein n=1 Tax=Streptomyces olindensis TaxID=358823 RepID=UPI0036B3DB6B